MAYSGLSTIPAGDGPPARWSSGSIVAVALVGTLIATGVVVTRPQVAGASQHAEFARQHLLDVRRTYPQALVSDGQGELHRPDGEDVAAIIHGAADPGDPRTFATALGVLLERDGQVVGVSRPAPERTERNALSAFALSVPEPSIGPGDASDGSTAFPVPIAPPSEEGIVGGGGYIDGIYGTAVITGDLSGDGLDDVVQWSNSDTARPGTQTTLEAVRGIDGTTVWQAAIAGDGAIGVALQAVGDITGDSLADVLVSTQEFEEQTEDECDADGCSYASTFTWRVQLRDGATGDVAWEQTYAGSQEYEDFFGGEDFRYLSRTVNGVVPFQPLQDVTNDGVGDFLVTLTTEEFSEQSMTEGSYPGPITQTSTSSGSAATRLQILDGRDASLVDEFVQPDGPEVVSGRPVPDLSGDGISDVLVTKRGLDTYTRTCVIEGTRRSCTEEGSRGGLEVSLLQAPDLGSVWSASYPLEFGGASAPGDLTGDGVRDVIVDAYSPVGQAILVVLDGSDGTQVWDQIAEDYFYGSGVVAITPIQTDGALDLITAEYGDTGEAQTLELVRRDGATGNVLFASSVVVASTTEDEYFFTSVAPAGDADADGAEDLLLLTESQTAEGFDVTTAVESGRTGDTLATLPSNGGAGYYRVAGDLDGDGGSDGVAFTDPYFYYAETTTQYTQDPDQPSVTAVRFVDGTVLWQQPAEPDTYVFAVQPAQFDGDAGGDLLISREQYTPYTFLQQIVAIDGEDGSTLWSAPPPPEVSRVAGSERIGTAVALSAATFYTADAVVIARADRFPDALAGGPLATAVGGPLLLTGSTGLDPQTIGEIQRLGATRALMLGGTEALSDQVVIDLQTLGLQVERLAGSDRFSTAAGVADRVLAETGTVERVAVAAGGSGDSDQGWTDAILASAYGAGTGVPLVLVQPDVVPQSTAEVLQRLAPTQFLTLVGDGTAISADTETALQQLLGIDTIRLARDTPEETSTHVANFAIRDGASSAAVWVATADRFPDALAATAAVGHTGGVLLLAGPADQGNDALLSFIGQLLPATNSITVIGGATAVAPQTAEAIESSVGS